MTVSILASFASAAAAVLLSPSGSDSGFYHCEDSVRWGSHYQATATMVFEVGFEAQGATRYRVSWSPGAAQAFLVSANWLRLRADTRTLPAPDEMGFGIRLAGRLQGGTILLIPAEGQLLALPVKKPAIRPLKNSGTIWVEIADPAQRARLVERGGWRFAALDSRGKVAAQGPLNLPDRAGMEIRYRPLAESLLAKAAAAASACQYEPPTEMRR